MKNLFNNKIIIFISSFILNQSFAQTVINQGPAPFDGGQSESIGDNQVGAVNSIAAHPTNANILYLGTVNGGIWRTHNAMSNDPDWEPLTDQLQSNSIQTLVFDSSDPTHQTLIAGIGTISSYYFIGGKRLGLLITRDGGDSWSSIGQELIGSNISGIIAQGQTIVVSVDDNDGDFSCDQTGLFRSTDGGVSFSQVHEGISGGSVDALTVDPNDASILYASVVLATSDCNGVTGIYKSTDTGSSWFKISNPQMDAALQDDLRTHVEIAVGQHNNVYVAIMKPVQDSRFTKLSGIFRSGNGGSVF